MILHIVICLPLCGISPQQKDHSRGYKIKAAFLYNFTQFIEWPAGSFTNEESPFVIGILGNDPFGTYLDQLVSEEQVNGHPLIVRRYNRLEEIDTCHILFINPRNRGGYERILPRLKDKNILTVGDHPEFAEEGGMIQFFTEYNKTRIRINLEIANRENIQISSKLLRLAEII